MGRWRSRFSHRPPAAPCPAGLRRGPTVAHAAYTPQILQAPPRPHGEGLALGKAAQEEERVKPVMLCSHQTPLLKCKVPTGWCWL